MKKLNRVLIGIILCCASLSSFATVTECRLGQWCELARAADYALIDLYPEDGAKYNCTASVNGIIDGNKIVRFKISGSQGFEMNPHVISVHQGGSYQLYVKGNFPYPHEPDPVIMVSRLSNNSSSSTNEMSYVMCQKA